MDTATYLAREEARKEEEECEIEYRARKREREIKIAAQVMQILRPCLREIDPECTLTLAQMIEIFSVMLCLPVATAFYERDLPREIRDMVYAYLISSAPNGTKSFKPYDNFHHIARDVFFAIDPAFVGKEMAREVAELYYTTERFTINSSQPETLTNDPHNIGVKPADFLTRLKISPNAHLSRPYNHGYVKGMWAKDIARVRTEMRALANVVLERVKRKDRLYVNIVINTRFPESLEPDLALDLDGEKDLAIVLDLIRHPVYDLMHACKDVHIEHEDGWHLNRWFKMSREEVEKVCAFAQMTSRSAY